MNKPIKTFEEACEALGVSTAVPDVSALPQKHQKAVIAHYQLVIIAEALNEGWQPNWNDGDEWKYYPWFEVKADQANTAGSGLSYGGCGYATSSTYFGSRLCFKSRDLAKYAGQAFTELYKDYFLLG
jgi:hypothetical protein